MIVRQGDWTRSDATALELQPSRSKREALRWSGHDRRVQVVGDHFTAGPHSGSSAIEAKRGDGMPRHVRSSLLETRIHWRPCSNPVADVRASGKSQLQSGPQRSSGLGQIVTRLVFCAEKHCQAAAVSILRLRLDHRDRGRSRLHSSRDVLGDLDRGVCSHLHGRAAPCTLYCPEDHCRRFCGCISDPPSPESPAETRKAAPRGCSVRRQGGVRASGCSLALARQRLP